MRRKFDLSLLPAAPDLSFEIPLWEAGFQRIAGIDEAGRGALAGPVAAAAVVLPPDPSLALKLAGVRDSKQMTPGDREFWAKRVKQEALSWCVGFASHEEIDRLGIVPASCLAMGRALHGLPAPAQHLLVDFLRLPECLVPQTALVKACAAWHRLPPSWRRPPVMLSCASSIHATLATASPGIRLWHPGPLHRYRALRAVCDSPEKF
jgi:hypothetical protein